MHITFIMVSSAREDKIFKTINSLKKQTIQDYELIIANDNPLADKEAFEFLHDQFVENTMIKILNNSKTQGNSNNWESGIKIAEGKYVSFIKEGDVLEPNFIETIINVDKQNPGVDLIDVRIEAIGNESGVIESWLKTDKLYNLPNDSEVYAYIGHLLYGKLFRTSIIKDQDIHFVKNYRYDLLFTYKFLAYAKTFYLVEKPLLKHRFSPLKYTALDHANQWPHVLNYYRDVKLYKDLQDELQYSHYRFLTCSFLDTVKKIDNPTLYRKSLLNVKSKIDNRLNLFLTKNKCLASSMDQKFLSRITKLDAFIEKELKTTKLK